MAFTAPDIRAGSSASHTIHVHAVDNGNLYVYFTQASGQIDWGGYGDRTGTANLGVIDVTPGGTDIMYTVTVTAGTESWKLQTTALHQVYTYGIDCQRAQTTFAVNGLPVHERHLLLGRDITGRLWQYTGTGTTTAPLGPRALIGSGWNTYNQLVVPGD
ncbi:hypothetical protein AB0M29_41335 [Streptomyces sp. NPDC051976]|uniref:hypothetical protein n=1 Tax=Streptomyces sp. NPDC051976 TaxID=3154947 RepID=UPI003446D8EC